MLLQLSEFGPPGSWAVVTGGSDGIGKEFALDLASKGYNVVLVARSNDKLQAVSRDIVAQYGSKVSVKTFSMDFARNNDDDFDRLDELLRRLNVSILVNNVGCSHSIPVSFIETAPQEMANIIMVNCMATLRLTQLVAPRMVAQKRGLILIMASFGGVFPTPLLATYSGSKAFLQYWGTALGAELEPHGVRVQVVQSHLVTTAMSKIRRVSALVPAPRPFVRAVMAKIGRSGGAQYVAFTSTPYWSHGIMQWLLSTFFGAQSAFIVGRNKAIHEDIRRRALRKAEREAKSSDASDIGKANYLSMNRISALVWLCAFKLGTMTKPLNATS